MENFYENDGENITITFENYGEENRNLGELMDWLGEVCGITQINELYQFACADDCGNLFNFTNEDEVRLAKDGKISLQYTGETINDYKETHKSVYNWFFNIK